MNKIKIFTISGTESEVTIDCGKKMIEDNYEDIPLSKKLVSWKKINCITDGVPHYIRDFHTKTDLNMKWVSDDVKKALAREEVFGTASGHRTDGHSDYITLVLDEENFKLLNDAINQDIEQNTTGEAEKFIKKKEENERQEKIDSLKEILKRAELIKSNGKLMTDAEAEMWKKNYNDVMNEGGIGYVPEITTIEMVEYAKEELEKLEGMII